MQSVRLRCRRIRRHGQRGAVSVVFAIVLVPVLLGMAALAIDGGSLYLGRQNAQNGADAAALALAKACAEGASDCTEDVAGSGLSSVVAGNVRPGSGVLEDLCIRKAGVGCTDADLTDLSQCAYSLSSSAQGVQARTRSDVPLVFAALFGKSVGHPQACSSAVWGKVGSISAVLPITFSTCEWEKATGGDPYDPTSGNYPPPPPYPPYPDPALGYEKIVFLQNMTDDTQGCETFNGHDSPGGFGWVDSDGTNCGSVVQNGDWIHVDTGNNTPSNCTPMFDQLKTSTNPIVFVPIYDCMRKDDPGSAVPDATWDCKQGTGDNQYYHIVGYAKFYLTGWHLSSSEKQSPNLGFPCTGGSRCLSGYFLKGLVDEGEISADPTIPSFGVSVVDMVG